MVGGEQVVDHWGRGKISVLQRGARHAVMDVTLATRLRAREPVDRTRVVIGAFGTGQRRSAAMTSWRPFLTTAHVSLIYFCPSIMSRWQTRSATSRLLVLWPREGRPRDRSFRDVDVLGLVN